MYAKLIKCDVDSDMESLFSKGQEHWSETASAEGFVRQFGGWDGDQAIILALWKDKPSVEQFMRAQHDAIADRANQSNTYSSIDVSYFDEIMGIPANEPSSNQTPVLIRIADCEVIEGKAQEFLEVQSNVWNDGMSSIQGMLGGYVWKSATSKNRYLITTFWCSESAHEIYIREHFAELKKLAQINTHISTHSGHIVVLENAWVVSK